MKAFVLTCFVAMVVTGPAVSEAPDLSKLPKPQKEHEWLKHFEGEWESDLEIYFEPGKSPLKAKGTESGRAIGGFWVVSEFSCTIMDSPMKGVMTLGYDPEKKQYVGTMVDSMTSHLWKYTGTLDPTGKILTLETQGPCPRKPDTISKFKEVIEFKSKDQRVFTSSMQEEDGKWTTAMIMNSRRK